MKKTIIAMLALSGVAFGATADELNTNLADWAADWDGGDYTLSVTITGQGTGDYLKLSGTWGIYTQVNRYVAVSNGGNPGNNWDLKGEAAQTDPYIGTLTAGTSVGWLVDTNSNINGMTLKLQYLADYDTTSLTLATAAGTAHIYASIEGDVDLDTIAFVGQASAAELVYGGNTYDLTQAKPVDPTPAIPEPTTATLSLLALAGLAARRRRK